MGVSLYDADKSTHGTSFSKTKSTLSKLSPIIVLTVRPPFIIISISTLTLRASIVLHLLGGIYVSAIIIKNGFASFHARVRLRKTRFTGVMFCLISFFCCLYGAKENALMHRPTQGSFVWVMLCLVFQLCLCSC